VSRRSARRREAGITKAIPEGGTVIGPAKRARRTPSFGGREFPYVVELNIETVTPLREGLELAPLVPRLSRTFPDPVTWSVRMRRALVPLDFREAETIGFDRLLSRRLDELEKEDTEVPTPEALGIHPKFKDDHPAENEVLY
jgi:hypothetical protein